MNALHRTEMSAALVVARDVPLPFLKQIGLIDWSQASEEEVAEAVRELRRGIEHYGVPTKAGNPGYTPVSTGAKVLRPDVPQAVLDVYSEIAWGQIGTMNLLLLKKGIQWVIKNHVSKRLPLRK